VIVFGLLLPALVMGWKHYRDVRTQHELAQRETRAMAAPAHVESAYAFSWC